MAEKPTYEELEKRVQELEKIASAFELIKADKQRLEMILSSLETGLSLINPDFTISWVNDTIRSIFPNGEPVGKTCHRFFESSENMCDPCPTFEVYKSGRTRKLDKYNPSKDKWYSIISQPVKDDAGQIVNVLEGITEITERKNYEQQILKEKNLLQQVMETSPVGITMVDEKGNVSMANARAEEVLGLKRSDIYKRRYNDQEWQIKDVQGDEYPDDQLPFELVKKSGKSVFGIKHSLVWPDGKKVLLSINATPLLDSSGNFNGMVSALQDITERKKTEELLREKAILLEHVTNNMSDMVSLADLEGRFVFVGKSHERILGYATEELKGKNVLDFVHPDDRPEIAEKFKYFVRTGDIEIVQYRYRQKDNHYLWLETIGELLFDENQKPKEIIFSTREITERKQAEEALRESEVRFRSIYDNTAIGLAQVSLDLHIMNANKAYHDMLGYKENDLIGRHLKEITHLDVMDENFQKQAKLASGEIDHYRMVKKFTHKNGQAVHAILDANLIRDTLGNPVYFLGSVVDITERKKMEEALQISEKKWRSVLKNTPQVGISLNTRAEITFVNEHFLALTGWKEHEVIGQNWFDMFIPESIREDVRKVFHTVMCQKDTLGLSNYENEIVGKSGEIFNVAWSNVLTKNAEENVIDVTCLGVDLTERKRSEDILRKSETKYRKMMEAIKDPLYICSESHKIQYMNQAMLDRVGYDATGKLCYEALHGLDKKCQWCKYDASFIGDHVEKNIISPLDNRSFNVSSTVFLNDGGSISKLSVLRDTTDFLQLQNRLQQAQKMESIGNLAGGIAHDFNNLLFPIVGLSEMMLNDFPPDSMENQNIREIFNAGTRGRELIQQILSFSRQSEHQPIPVHIQKILKEVLKLCRSTIPANITITQDIQTNCAAVMADPTQIHQIAMNLITNAYHAVEPTGGAITIQLKEINFSHKEVPDVQLSSGRYAVLSVTDTGTGIDPAVMNKIFDPYFTTKEKGKGTGLGLATVYGIIKAHGGDIRVYSEAGKGSSFNVYLPLLEKSKHVVPEKQNQALPTGTEHILLVDDEKPIVQIEKQMLERLGYHTSSFTSSSDALTAFKTDPSRFDLVITDMNMPQMTGMQLAAELIAIRPDIPIILSTGFSERIDNKKAEAQGIRGLLLKPVGMKDFAQKLREVLDTS